MFKSLKFRANSYVKLADGKVFYLLTSYEDLKKEMNDKSSNQIILSPSNLFHNRYLMWKGKIRCFGKFEKGLQSEEIENNISWNW